MEQKIDKMKPNLVLAAVENDQNASKNQPSKKVKPKGAKSTDSELFWISHLWVLPR